VKKLLCIILSILLLTFCGCSQEKQKAVSEADVNSRLTATPEELIELYFEYLENENAAGIASLYSEKHNMDLYPDTENYAEAVSKKDAIFVTYKGYKLEYLETSSSSFSYEMYPENNTEAVMQGYDNANGYGKINCEAHFLHPIDGDRAIVPFNFVFVQINGIWYFAL